MKDEPANRESFQGPQSPHNLAFHEVLANLWVCLEIDGRATCLISDQRITCFVVKLLAVSPKLRVKSWGT